MEIKKRITISLDIENFEYIKKMARLENRSVSNCLNVFIKDFKSNNKLTLKQEIKSLRIGD
ncbi:hypothetical protein N5U00_02045 [Aliarcobacter butzleri]|uniref:hypothetical protein n=1 Tax=Aliarcobacter butzleri TaxID=28197 RepID=UPI0021B57B97|nr:hypothetical protein [Aliarcobacter butzleri]MCT7574098.1 hypothetical protein [Aliarcobacter butzleri]